jgi:hypothetical protein
VRSSSPLEGDGTWSGAFSSFHGIGHDELGDGRARLLGGGLLGRGARPRRTGHRTRERSALAVLVQPELRPDLGGTARVAHDGTVRITATTGPLRP